MGVCDYALLGVEQVFRYQRQLNVPQPGGIMSCKCMGELRGQGGWRWVQLTDLLDCCMASERMPGQRKM